MRRLPIHAAKFSVTAHERSNPERQYGCKVPPASSNAVRHKAWWHNRPAEG